MRDKRSTLGDKTQTLRKQLQGQGHSCKVPHKWYLAITKLPLRQGRLGETLELCNSQLLNCMEARSEVEDPETLGDAWALSLNCYVKPVRALISPSLPWSGEWICDICPACFLGCLWVCNEIVHEASPRGEEVLLILLLQKLGSRSPWRVPERNSQPSVTCPQRLKFSWISALSTWKVYLSLLGLWCPSHPLRLWSDPPAPGSLPEPEAP